ncbi:shikimate dehydrogenase [Microbacterium sp. NC79]|uniref:shikimate dehydrogenase family protein n=1 Tax=Microbacterium sp. NC79 TaxID=2851009 RepID=UPI0020B66148|nr:shikimate dehydrogenase [Microbacterium sp. NC79]
MRSLQVWGDPIAHSRSPLLHTAAYAALGLDWQYSRRQVTAEQFDAELAGLDDSYRGLSLTMPLKEAAFAVAGWRDERAERTGAVNTLLLGAGAPRGFNTDIGGFLGALRENGVTEITRARIIGAGATASSAMVALAEAGAETVEVIARTPAKAMPILHAAGALGITATAIAMDDVSRFGEVDATIATLPGGTMISAASAERLAETGGVLLDAVYAPWPTQLADAFGSVGKPSASGELMLLHQALLQVRVFVNEDVHAPLMNEDVILAAMRAALMGD